jgi:hypothetical protein
LRIENAFSYTRRHHTRRYPKRNRLPVHCEACAPSLTRADTSVHPLSVACNEHQGAHAAGRH